MRKQWDSLGRDRQDLKRVYSTWESWRRGSFLTADVILSMILLVACWRYSGFPMGEPRRVKPCRWAQRMRRCRGYAFAGSAMPQMEDLALLRLRPSAGPLRATMSRARRRAGREPPMVPSSMSQHWKRGSGGAVVAGGLQWTGRVGATSCLVGVVVEVWGSLRRLVRTLPTRE